MNWIINNSTLMPYHTQLDVILSPLKDDVMNLQWLISDLDYIGADKDFPLNLDDKYFIVSPDKFKQVLNPYMQTIWGVFLGIPVNIEIKVEANEIPYVEGNPVIWEAGNIQHPEALIEIDCFDSSDTIVKFTKKHLSDKFKTFFGDEALPLEKF